MTENPEKVPEGAKEEFESVGLEYRETYWGMVWANWIDTRPFYVGLGWLCAFLLFVVVYIYEYATGQLPYQHTVTVQVTNSVTYLLIGLIGFSFTYIGQCCVLMLKIWRLDNA